MAKAISRSARQRTVGVVCQLLENDNSTSGQCCWVFTAKLCDISTTSAAASATHEPINIESVKVNDESRTIGPSQSCMISQKPPPCSSARAAEAQAESN